MEREREREWHSDDVEQIRDETTPFKNGAKSPIACGGLNAMTRNYGAVPQEAKPDESNALARRKLLYASIFCAMFMVAEIVGGLYANSLAILSDAAHLLSDLGGFMISIFALWLASIAPTSNLSFGFHRAEILGALLSVLVIWLMTGVLVYEATYRISHPQHVNGKLMFIVAVCGLAVNIIMGVILHQSGHTHSHGLSIGGGHGHSHGPAKKKPKETPRSNADKTTKIDVASHSEHGHSHSEHGHSHSEHGHSHSEHGHSHSDHGHSHSEHGHSHSDHGHSHSGESKSESEGPQENNINVNAAFLHVLGDGIQSLGVMIAAALIWHNPDWRIADPICTFLFSVLVLITTVRLIKQSVGVLMEGVPEGIDPDEVQADLSRLAGVLQVHDLHIWSLSVGKPSLSAHLLVQDDTQSVLQEAHRLLAVKFNIHHTTIQVEKKNDQVSCNPHYQ